MFIPTNEQFITWNSMEFQNCTRLIVYYFYSSLLIDEISELEKLRLLMIVSGYNDSKNNFKVRRLNFLVNYLLDIFYDGCHY